MDLSPLQLGLVAAAGTAAGFVNAVAGGGTLISFPALTLVGLPTVSANITNTVALSPGYLGGAYAQRRDLSGQARRLRWLIPAGMAGGICGGVLLLSTSTAVFRELVPFLILLACALLAAQNRVRAALERRASSAEVADDAVGAGAVLAVFVAAIYGGYFGAGLGIILLAVLGSVLHGSLIRTNALKQVLSFTINTTAALFFIFSGRVVWPAAVVMAVGSIVGGTLGGRTASRLDPDRLRAIVIVVGVAIAIVYFVR